MGFFFEQETKGRRGVDKKTQKRDQLPISTLRSEQCRVCTLGEAKLYTPRMKATGATRPDVYILGEAPGQNEDKRGEQFVGKAGRFLRDCLPDDIDYRFNNVLRCRPPDNRTPTPLEVECCRPFQEEDIEKAAPTAIFGFGATPLTWALPKADKIMLWRGRRFAVQVGNHVCWYYPFLHPSFVIRNQDDYGRESPYEKIFKQDLRSAVSSMGDPVEIEDPKKYFDNIHLITGKGGDKDVEKVVRWLRVLREEKRVALDLETVNLRPYRSDSRILTVSIGTYDRVIAFPLRFPNTWTGIQLRKVERKLVEYLTDAKVVACHNLAFELEWIGHFFGKDLLRKACQWVDTMGQAYILDERKDMHSLDVLTRLHFGFFIKSLSTVDVKNLINEPLKDVLTYNALDSKYTSKLDSFQLRTLKKERLLKVYKEQERTVPTLVSTEMAGVLVDPVRVQEFSKEYRLELDDLSTGIQKHPDVVAYRQSFGAFNPSSNPQVAKFLRFAGFRVGTGVSESVLEQIDHPICHMILRLRHVRKLKSTYIDSIPGHTYPDGRMHCQYKSNWTSTGRWASEDPNLQNFPKRKDRKIRSVVVATPGTRLGAYDYGQIEARVLGMISNDKNFCKALWENYDVHMEWAERIVKAQPSVIGGRSQARDAKVMKAFRSRVKNEMVFPFFFGAGKAKVSGLLGLSDSVINRLYREFWKMFAGIREWQESLQEFYDAHGYVETLTGRRRLAPMGYNQMINAPIQGTAADIVVNAMNRLSEEGYVAVLNVHDDLTFEHHIETLDAEVEYVANAMCNVPFSWVNVPITVELALGGDWSDLEEVQVFSSN